jgi:ABC-type glycerol-3-phosphate transport system permease component
MSGHPQPDCAHRTQDRIRLGIGLRHLLALVVGLGFGAPFVWSVLSSLKAPYEIFLFPPRWLPEKPLWTNYLEVWTMIPFARFYANTLIVTIVAILGEVMVSVVVAYGFARFRFPGREALFTLVIATLILPVEVTLIPRFLLFRAFKWLDTFLPLTFPSYFGAAFFVFMLRQFFLTLPLELDEAAELDGAGALRLLSSVLLPLLAPALATVAVFSFLGHWNDFMSPLIYLRSTNKFTLALGLRFLQTAADMGGRPREPFLMAASLMATVPCVVLFVAAQRYFVRGVVMSGIKG